MVRYLTVIGLGILFYLGLFASPSFAAKPDDVGNPNPHNTITLDLPDEGDNAHPSGKDRSVEHGGSGTQGKSASDPDDDTRGPDRTNNGPDKQPDGAGGVDKEDQDNNNGCGNDDDFEDDNEGLCGGAPKGGPPGDEDGDGNGNGHGGNGDGNGGNGDGDEDGDVEGQIVQPRVVNEPGGVLGIQSLPQTASPARNDNYLPTSLALILAGITLHVISKRFGLIFPK